MIHVYFKAMCDHIADTIDQIDGDPNSPSRQLRPVIGNDQQSPIQQLRGAGQAVWDAQNTQGLIKQGTLLSRPERIEKLEELRLELNSALDRAVRELS